MGLIPDVSSIVSGLFDSGSTGPDKKSKDLTTLGSADTQGTYFRKNIEGFGGTADGDGELTAAELDNMVSMGSKNNGPISPSQWPVLKFYGKMVQREDTTDSAWYYVNRFGIIRKTAHMGTSAEFEPGCNKVGDKLSKPDFDLLIENGGENFTDDDIGSPINIMPVDAQCGMDGQFVKEDSTSTPHGMIDPHTGTYRAFDDGTEGGTGCAARIIADTVGGFAADEFTHTGDNIPSTYSCTTSFPSRIGDMTAVDWDAAVNSEKGKAREYTDAIGSHKIALDAYTEFLDGSDSDGNPRRTNMAAPNIVPHLSQYYGKHVTVFGGSAGALTSNPNSDRYYVTNFGIPRKWAPPPGGGAWNSSGSAWQQKPDSCTAVGGNDAMDIVVHISQAHLDTLKTTATDAFGSHGGTVVRDMEIHEPCGISGKFVQVPGTDERAWVDIFGRKHAIGGSSHGTCTGDITYTDLTAEEYAAITTGNDYTEGTNACGASGLSSEEFTKYINLQSDLIAKGVAVMELVNELTVSNIPQVMENVAEERMELEASVDELVHQQTQISTNQKNAINAMGRFETGSEQTTYALRMYVVWLIVALLVMAITIHTMVSGENTIFVYGVLGFCALIMMYYMYIRATRG